jgi:hypothetical protein
LTGALQYLSEEFKVLGNGGRLGATVAAQVERHQFLVVLAFRLPSVEQHIPFKT